MRRALAVSIFVLFINQALAGDKKPMTPERVGQLLTILRSDLNDDNRAHAAEELGRVDASQFPEIIPMLIETLRTDPKAAVRAEVVDSLAKIRPVTKEAGKALEAAKEDGAFKVRWHARTAARTYHNAGYSEQDKKIAASTPKSMTSGTRVNSEPAPAAQSGSWFSNLMGKSSSAPQSMPAPPPQPVVTPDKSQSSGWLYHMIAKPTPATRMPASPMEPPLATPEPTAIRGNPEASGQPVTANPFSDIRSAPANPMALPRLPSSTTPPAPVVPVLPSKPGDSGLNLGPG